MSERGFAALADAYIQKLDLRQRLCYYKEAGKNTKIVKDFIFAVHQRHIHEGLECQSQSLTRPIGTKGIDCIDVVKTLI